MIGTALDNLIGVFSPRWAAGRVAYRLHTQRLRAQAQDHQAMRQLLGGRAGGYEAGKNDRLKNRVLQSAHENDIPRAQIATMRWRSWNLYRNNPQARKIIRTLNAKVIGRGLSPQPQTTKPDGTPFVEFRKRARQIWDEFVKEADFRGKPGRGGQHLTTLSKTAFRSIVLSGAILYRFHHLDRDEQKKRGLTVPLQLQLLHIDRLDETKAGDAIFNGVELDSQGRASRYWVLKGGTESGKEESVPIPASEMGHLFAEEDIDQILGSPWLGAALLTMDDRRTYESSELQAAEAASCIVGTYSRSGGHSGGLGLPSPDNERELTDASGNQITHLQPMMFVDVGHSGKVEIIGGNRPNISAEPFCTHLIRSEAVSVPGVKSSTLTGDYRNSSFSSERSADNDAWPELEDLQDWISGGFSQPIYEEVITVAVSSGLFDGVDEFTVDDFNERRRDYLKTNWQGPVARSINPKDDADASRQRVKNANSSPQREAAQIGRDWREILQEVREFIDYAEELELPADIWQQALGIEQTDKPTERETEQEQDERFAAARLRGFAAYNNAGAP